MSKPGSTPPHREKKFPYLEYPIYHRVFRVFSVSFSLQPVRTEEPLSQLTHRGRKSTLVLLPSLSAVGKVPGDSAVSLDPRVCSIFRSVRPPRKATASKHSRFTLVRFALFASRKTWLGGGQCAFDSLSCVPVLVGWNRRAVSPLPSLRPPSDFMPLVCYKGTEVTRRYERPSRLGVVVFACHWAIFPHRQSYAVA